MSYEPRLIISAHDLRGHENEIVRDSYAYPDDTAIQYVAKLLNCESVLLKGVSMIICHPELTSFNAEVRDTLDDYEIEYAIDN